MENQDGYRNLMEYVMSEFNGNDAVAEQLNHIGQVIGAREVLMRNERETLMCHIMELEEQVRMLEAQVNRLPRKAI